MGSPWSLFFPNEYVVVLAMLLISFRFLCFCINFLNKLFFLFSDFFLWAVVMWDNQEIINYYSEKEKLRTTNKMKITKMSTGNAKIFVFNWRKRDRKLINFTITAKFSRAHWLKSIRVQTIKMTSDVARALSQRKIKAKSTRNLSLLLSK